MTSINTNVGALNARLYALTSTGQNKAMERLSSGYASIVRRMTLQVLGRCW